MNKFNVNFTIFLCALILLCMPENIYAKDLNLAKTSIQSLYDFDAGLGSQGVNDIKQTSDGYIWVATYSGLFRYDGKNFLKIDHNFDESFTSTSINKLFLAKDGTLYVGSNDKGLFKYAEGKFSQIKYYSNVLSTSIRYINQDNNGTVYVSTSYGMGKIQNNALQSAGRAGLYTISVGQFTFDESNKLWGVVNDGTVIIAQNDNIINTWKLSWKDSSRSAFRLSDALQDAKKDSYKYNASAITKLKDSTLLVGTNEGYVFRAKYDKKLDVISRSYNMLLTHTNGFYEDHENKIWAFSDLGVGYFNQQMDFVELGGLKSDIFMQAVYQDHEQNFWFASQRDGLLHLTKSYFHEEDFPKNNATFVNATAIWKNKLYIATDQGVTIADGGKNVLVTHYFDGIRVRALMVDSTNSLWGGTYTAYNLGLVKINPDSTINEFTTAQGLSSNFIQVIYEKRDGSILAGTRNGLNVIKNNKIIQDYFEDNTILNQSILSLMELDDGHVLVGTDGGGIFVMSDGRILKKITSNDGLNSNIIYRMTKDPASGIIFISTGSNTLDMYDPKKDEVKNISTFVANSNIHDIKIIGENIIILAENTIYKTPLKSLLSNKPEVQIFGDGKGLQTPISPMSWNTVDKSNKLYICASENVYSIDFEKDFSNDTISNVIITSIEVDSKKYYENLSQLTLNPEDLHVRFNFAYLTYDNTADSTVSYILEGFDKDYRILDYSKEYTAQYTNLPYGKYVFKIQGSNLSTGKKSAEVSVPLIVKPHLIETTETKVMFFTMALVVCFIVTRLIYSRRVNQALKKHAQLRAVTNQFIFSFSKIIDAKDTYTNGHSARVAYYSVNILKALKYSENYLESIYYTALLHDIGKVGVSDVILNKSSHLEQEEYEIIQKHTLIGANILKNIKLVEDIALGAKYHHEKFDGSGYPNGLKGEEIPLFARIIGVADAFDAMTSGRSYQTNTIEWGIEELKNCAGSHFDPKIVKIFTKLIEKGIIHVYDGTGDLDPFKVDLN